jgi:NAD(P)-dependent dehydrogenase (short-subunit alcohol dehydrogenase family)
MKTDFTKKTILLTGATDGLGKLVAKKIAMKGAYLLIHGRNKEKGKRVVKELKELTNNNNIVYYNADYASFQEVYDFGEEILSLHNQIDILINNVGIGAGTATNYNREISKDGMEMRFQVNYLSHVLLTEILLPVCASNIINIASLGQEPVDFNNIMLEKNYDGYFAYKQSKSALIMYTYDLAERLKGSPVKANAIHPASLMPTKMVLDFLNYSQTTVEEGAEAVENILLTEESGQFYDGKKISRSISQTYNKEVRKMLKKVSYALLEKYLNLVEH